MAHRRGDCESYRPSHHDNHNAREHESSSRFESRPRVPSRSDSRFSSVSKDFRSPDDTPVNSPRSPQPTYGQGSSTTNAHKTAVSRDPRRTRAEQSTFEQSHMISPGSTLIDYFRELAKQVSWEEKVQEAERKLKATKDQEQLMKQRFSDNNPLADQYSKDRKRDQDALSKYLQVLAESKDHTEKTLANLPPKAKDIFSGVIPAPRAASPHDELSDVKFAVKSLEEKMENLIKQNREQETELKQLRERNTRPPSEPLEAKLTSRTTASQREIDSKSIAINEKLQKYNESLSLHEKTINQHQEDLQKQRGEIRSLTSKQVAITGPVASLQQRVEKLETQDTEAALRGTHRSTPRDDFEDEVAEIKAQQKEHKRQMADLSNMFIPRQEYLDSFAKLEALTKSTEKLVKDTDKAQQDLSSRLPAIVDRTGYTEKEIDDIKRSVEVFAAADPKILHQRVDNLSQSHEQLKQSIENLSKNAAVQTATQVPVAQSPTHDSEVVSKLQNEVKKLTDFSGHYTKFYERTEGQIRQINQQLTADDKRMTEIKDGLQSRSESLEELCQKNQAAIHQLTERQKKDEEQAQSVLRLRGQIEECRSNCASAFAQSAAMVTDIKAMKVTIEQVSHSIQSLDTRYSAISTQKLYHSIVATIQPLIPRIYELTEQLSSVRRSIATWEHRTTMIDNKIQLNETDKAETMSKIQALENEIRGLPTTTTSQLAAPQPGGSPLQQVQNSVQQDSEIQNTITILRGQHDNCISQLKLLQDKIITIEQTMKNQQQNATDQAAPLLQRLSQLSAELQQNKTEISPKVLNELSQVRDTIKEIRNEMTTIELTLTEERKVVDSLKAKVGILDDLQSHVHNVQTDVTAHQQFLAKIDTDLPLIQNLNQRLNRLQSRVEETLPDGRQVEFVKSKQEQSNTAILGLGQIVQIEESQEALFPAQDRYIGCSNLASTVTEEKVNICFKDCDVRQIRFGGGKIGTKTTRYAIIMVDRSTNTEVIEAAIRKQDGNPWEGRRPIIRSISRDLFRTIWLEKPNCIKDLLLGPQDMSNSRVSEVASTPGPTRGISINNNVEQRIPDNTIEVVRSSVLPRRQSTKLDVTELPDSDEELDSLHHKFGATKDGKSSRPLVPARAGSTRLSTPSSKGPAKRGPPDPDSSRPSSKRGRR